MSIATKTIFDVFLSHGQHDKGIADFLKKSMEEEGLEVFSVQEVKPGKSFLSEMRKSLAECSAVVIILTRSTVGSPNLAFEVGAAMAWNKPVYVLYDGISKKEIPEFLRDFNVAQVSEISKIAKKIVSAQEPFSDEDRGSLVDVYTDMGVPTDQLLRMPVALHDLSERYNAIMSSNIAGDKLIQELIRLRKQGKLPALNRK